VTFEPTVTIRVLHAHTDAMGIVYHGAILPWLEHARVEYMRARGLVYADLERAGLGLPVTELFVRYRAPGRHDDRVRVACRAERDGRARLRFEYRVEIEARAGRPVRILMAEATTRHACVRLSDGRPVRLPEALGAAIGSC